LGARLLRCETTNLHLRKDFLWLESFPGFSGRDRQIARKHAI